MSSPRKVVEILDAVVIGGGLAGLVAGLRLRELLGDSASLRILESGPRAGGRTLTERSEGFACEWAAECFHIPEDDPGFRWLLGVCGLSPVKARSISGRRFIIKNGDVVPLGPGIFLTSRLLSLRARLRLLSEVFRSGPPIEDASLAEFARRRLGPETVDNLFLPMCRGIFAGDPESLSLRSAFPRLSAIEESGGLTLGVARSLFGAVGRLITRTPKPAGRGMWSFGGGLSTLIEALEAALGRDLTLNCGVESLTRERDVFRIETREGESLRTARLIVATPAQAAGRMLAELDPVSSEVLKSIESQDVSVVGLGYRRDQVKRPLGGFGALVGPDDREAGERLEALGYLCSSETFEGRAPEGHVLFRVLFGGAKAPELATAGEAVLVDLARKELGVLMGVEGEPVWSAHFEHRQGIPQYNLGHGERLERLEKAVAAWPDLALAGSAYRGPGLADTLRSGLRAAESLSKVGFSRRNSDESELEDEVI